MGKPLKTGIVLRGTQRVVEQSRCVRELAAAQCDLRVVEGVVDEGLVAGLRFQPPGFVVGRLSGVPVSKVDAGRSDVVGKPRGLLHQASLTGY